jgi:hypothetical protein
MPSQWTVDTLKEHVETVLAEKDKAINIALNAAKEAVNVAEKNAEKWRDNANEWRAAMNDKDKTLMQKAEFITYKEATEKALVAEKQRGDKGEGKNDAYVKFIGYIIAAAAIIFAYLKK